MSYLITKRLGASITLLIPALLAACSAVQPVDTAEDPRLARLMTGMDQCLVSQQQAGEQLQRQEQQLAQQQVQLQDLAAVLANPPGQPQAGSAVAAEVCARPRDESSKLVVGQLEQVWLQNLELALPGRIDTGAETASLDARNIELFERNGRRWVRFEILHPETGEPMPLERKLKRMVVIVQSNTAEPERRPVIKLGVTIGHISQTAEFTLSDRSHLDYQLLIGRNILQDVMVVDVSKQNIAPFDVPESADKNSDPTL